MHGTAQVLLGWPTQRSVALYSNNRRTLCLHVLCLCFLACNRRCTRSLKRQRAGLRAGRHRCLSSTMQQSILSASKVCMPPASASSVTG